MQSQASVHSMWTTTDRHGRSLTAANGSVKRRCLCGDAVDHAGMRASQQAKILQAGNRQYSGI